MNLSSDKIRPTKKFLLLSTASINTSDSLTIAVLPVLRLNINMHGFTVPYSNNLMEKYLAPRILTQ